MPRKTPAAAVPAPAVEPVRTIDAAHLPPTLDPDKAEALFRELESGTPRTKAPARAGLAYRTVFRWCKTHEHFRARCEEAEHLGYQAQIDTIPEIAATAVDRETAAAVTARVGALDKYLKLCAPHRFNVKQTTLALPGSDDTEARGVVILPAKVTGRGLPPSAPIEGVAIRVPAKQLPAPGEDVTDA